MALRSHPKMAFHSKGTYLGRATEALLSSVPFQHGLFLDQFVLSPGSYWFIWNNVIFTSLYIMYKLENEKCVNNIV